MISKIVFYAIPKVVRNWEQGYSKRRTASNTMTPMTQILIKSSFKTVFLWSMKTKNPQETNTRAEMIKRVSGYWLGELLRSCGGAAVIWGEDVEVGGAISTRREGGPDFKYESSVFTTKALCRTQLVCCKIVTLFCVW